jgi:hypothetical protein
MQVLLVAKRHHHYTKSVLIVNHPLTFCLPICLFLPSHSFQYHMLLELNTTIPNPIGIQFGGRISTAHKKRGGSDLTTYTISFQKEIDPSVTIFLPPFFSSHHLPTTSKPNVSRAINWAKRKKDMSSFQTPKPFSLFYHQPRHTCISSHQSIYTENDLKHLTYDE